MKRKSEVGENQAGICRVTAVERTMNILNTVLRMDEFRVYSLNIVKQLLADKSGLHDVCLMNCRYL